MLRCAIYTRKSTEHGLELEFNSLDAQREACEAYIKSQAAEGWRVLPKRYDDAAYSGGNLDRPALTPSIGIVTMSPLRWTALHIGASFWRDRCGRVWL